MTIARHNTRRTSPLATVENGIISAYAFGLESRTAMGFPSVPLKPQSRTPAPADMPGANCGLTTGGIVNSRQLIAVELFDPGLASLMTRGGLTVSTTASIAFLLLADRTVEPARYVVDDRPIVTIHGRGGMILFDGSTEPNGRRVVVSGRRTHARDLPVFNADDMDTLVAAITAIGGTLDDSPEEAGIDPSWPLDLRVEMVEAAMRKLQRRLDALEADDEPAGADRPRRPHRRVNPLPDAVN